MPVKRALRRRLVSATLLGGTGLAVLDVSIQILVGSRVAISLLALLALVRLVLAVAISQAFVGRISVQTARWMAFGGAFGMIFVMAAYRALLSMRVVSAGPIEWIFFLSSVASQTIGTGGFGRWIVECVDA
ncbi:MAG: hypothetical protein C4341_03680 [Armatimonadota bacterium]